MFKKTLSLLIVSFISLQPLYLLAQITTAAESPTPADSSAAAVPAVASPAEMSASVPDASQPITLSPTSSSPQSATTTQLAVSGSVIESTFDPNQTGTSSDPVLTPPDNVLPSDSIPVPVAENPNIPPASQTITTTIEEQVTEVIMETVTSVAQINEEDLNPKEKYTFKLNGAPIATKNNPDWKRSKNVKGASVSEMTISAVADVTPDAAAGTLEVSGACNDPYFVVLLYKNQEDYDLNPGSYIFNKALDCVNGAYAYSIKDLPPMLPDGTYYLLIGGQGNVGSWKPITALMPITIQKQ